MLITEGTDALYIRCKGAPFSQQTGVNLEASDNSKGCRTNNDKPAVSRLQAVRLLCEMCRTFLNAAS